MKVSEKTLELNIGAEILWLLRTKPGLRKMYLRGLTQREEKAEGVDFFAQLDPEARLFAFQFKAPKGKVEAAPYKFRVVDYQHRALCKLAKHSPLSVFYVFPFIVGSPKIQRHSPNLLNQTWFLDVSTMPERTLFGARKSRTLSCTAGIAKVNPEYALIRLSGPDLPPKPGLTPKRFAAWYEEFRIEHRSRGSDGGRHLNRRDPWLARGLRVAIAVPDGDGLAT